MIARGWTPEKTHDITRLLDLCAEHDKAFTELVTEGAVLNEYITAGRYPEDIAYEEIGQDDAVEAAEVVRRIRALVIPSEPAQKKTSE